MDVFILRTCAPKVCSSGGGGASKHLIACDAGGWVFSYLSMYVCTYPLLLPFYVFLAAFVAFNLLFSHLLWRACEWVSKGVAFLKRADRSLSLCFSRRFVALYLLSSVSAFFRVGR